MIYHILVMRLAAFGISCLRRPIDMFGWQWLNVWDIKCASLWLRHYTLFNLCEFREREKKKELRKAIVMAKRR